MPIKRTLFWKYRSSLLTRAIGVLTAILTVAIVLVTEIHRAFPASGCIELIKTLRNGDYYAEKPFRTDVFDASSGFYLGRSERAFIYAADGFKNSPDDNYIAYKQYGDGGDTVELVIARTGVGNSSVLREKIAEDGNYWWSHDSRWVGYSTITLDGQRRFKLREVVSPQRVITVPLHISSRARLVGWSADMHYIAISDSNSGKVTITIFSTPDMKEVMVSSRMYPNLDTANWPYPYLFDASWSPQGNTLVYRADDGSGSQLILLFPDSKTEREEKLSLSIAPWQQIFWSPHGKYIAVLSVKDGTGDDHTLDIFGVEGTTWRSVTKQIQNANCWDSCLPIRLFWSEDETSITYVNHESRPSYSMNLITFRLADNHYETIGTYLYMDPDSLQDKRWMWVMQGSEPEMQPIVDTILYSPTLHRKIVLTTYNESQNKTESPDGKIAVAWNFPYYDDPAYDWNPRGKGLVWVRLADGILHKVEDSAKIVKFLNWSANSQWFSYVVAPDGEKGEVYLGIANMNTGEYHRIIGNFQNTSAYDSIVSGLRKYRFQYGGYTQATPSPDGKFIVLIGYDEQQTPISTQIIHTSNGSYVSVDESFRTPAWSPDGSQVALIVSEEYATLNATLKVYKNDGTPLYSRQTNSNADRLVWTDCYTSQ